MGDTTTNRAYRKPLSTDGAANLTDYWRNLADDVDSDVNTNIFGVFTTFQTYTPVVTASSTNPTGHTITGRYMQFGKLVIYEIALTFATSEGTGASYFVTLPVNTSMPGNSPHGMATFFDSSASTTYARTAISISASALAFVDTAGARLSPTVPVTVATGDKILVLGMYESV